MFSSQSGEPALSTPRQKDGTFWEGKQLDEGSQRAILAAVAAASSSRTFDNWRGEGRLCLLFKGGDSSDKEPR
ncbi:Hypothetical predicted protein [Podarcis lilfordi]|nr:Hypothetical predicted protein [Podarcis lilfordi]